MMIKSTDTTYIVNCRENKTSICHNTDASCGIPFIEILETKRPSYGSETSQEKFNLRLHDKESVDQLLVCLLEIKREMDRLEPKDQAVS